VLKFKSKKRNHFPKQSLLIWVVTLVAIVLSLYYQQWIDINNQFAIIPANMHEAISLSWTNSFKLISALFIHGNWQHWAGNMLLFLIIALPLERKLGSFWFVIIYLVSGISANLLSIVQLSDSTHYLLGASGAVSGLLGAWLMLFPRQKMSVIIPIGLYIQKISIPIVFVAIIWLSIQLVLQMTSIGSMPIVWGSHVIGFVVGFFIAWLYRVSNT